MVCTNLNFCYVGRVALLEDFSEKIPGDKLVAIIGKAGCGESTIAKLIVGLYQLQFGNMGFGNYNQQDLSQDCFQQQVVLLPQEAHFWSRS
ncbi:MULTISPECIES: ATP-binding cassette domain-containing protein [Aerosakkonema]|uniref:ATP-binding cassette domain-containing protein n=1 Tax=Aerosakkonema TaxID=1246629 RepID=UPI0035B79640